jgi:hypothetical protein
MCSVIVVYISGREYTEGTAKNMLALPIARSRFVFAKIIVSAVWFAIRTLWIIAETYLVGSRLGIAGLTTALFLASVFGHMGWGPWAPWPIIGLYSGAAGPETALSPFATRSTRRTGNEREAGVSRASCQADDPHHAAVVQCGPNSHSTEHSFFSREPCS